MKKYNDTFIYEGKTITREVNSITDEVKEMIKKLNKLAIENKYTLHCNEEVKNELREIINNLCIE